MFGLMRRAPPKMPYCGHLQAMGTLYGHTSRAIAAESRHRVPSRRLLMEHAGEPEWAKQYRSFNCKVTAERCFRQVARLRRYDHHRTRAISMFADHQADENTWKWRHRRTFSVSAIPEGRSETSGGRFFPLDKMGRDCWRRNQRAEVIRKHPLRRSFRTHCLPANGNGFRARRTHCRTSRNSRSSSQNLDTAFGTAESIHSMRNEDRANEF